MNIKPAAFAVTASMAFIFVLCSAYAVAYPDLEYYVTDQAGVLFLDEIYDIEANCEYVYLQKGVEMAVLIVNDTQPDDIFIFTLKTFEQNGLGQEGKDNGLLIVISVADQAWRIEVGYGLEGVLPDSKIGGIAEAYLVPFLAQEDYYSALLYTTEAIGNEILGAYDNSPPSTSSPYPISWIPLTCWELTLVALVVGALSIVTKGRIFLWLPFILMGKKGGGKNWGGGRSGGGGAGGGW
ncbi:MAG: TPM domain-containing protein [Candidatus Thermoplasmatota archaeon]|nr:TPM domain-containing protein [Candidatus Thermoplasmatota archaeon]